MRMQFLSWIPNMENYLLEDIAEYWDDCGDYPLFYKHKGVTDELVLEWAMEQAYERGDDGLIPFIRHIVKHYAKNRWHDEDTSDA
jgi:hypothetical protein